MSPPPAEPAFRFRWPTLLMALSELCWLVLVPLAGWRLGGGWWLGAIVAGLFLGLFLLVWGRWMASTSRHRLFFEYRQMLLILIGSALTIIAALVELFLPAAASSALLVWAHRRHYLGQPQRTGSDAA